MIYKLFLLIDRLGAKLTPEENTEDYEMINKGFIKAMSNDFNTSVAIAIIWEYVNILNKLLNKKEYQRAVNIKAALIKVFTPLGLLQQNPTLVIDQIKNKYLEYYKIDESEITNLILSRQAQKAERNWAEADRIRNELLEKGIVIKDSGDTTEWDVDIPPKTRRR